MTEFGTRLIEWGEKFCENVAIAGSEVLMEQMPIILESDYYDQYVPVVYDRIENFLDNSYEPYVERAGSVHKGGVYLSPDNMDDYEYTKLSKDTIYDFDMAGFHGSIKGISPYYSVLRFVNSREYADAVVNQAYAMTGNLS